MDRFVYFDHAATTPVDERVIEVLAEQYRTDWGNPNSLYRLGRDAYRTLEDARERFMAGINAQHPAEVLFMSGGTEADNAALFGIANAVKDKGRGHVVVSSYEHPAVLDTAKQMAKRGWEVEFVSPRGDGVVYAEDLAALVRDDTAIVSIMHGNNEIGTVNDIAALAAVAHAKGAYFHTDSVQTLGKIPFDVVELGVDAASFSAHKIHGPKGVGVMYLKKGTPYQPFIFGGGQEFRRRSGTQNVAGAVAFATALELMLADQAAEAVRLSTMRDRLIAGVMDALPNIELTAGTGQARLPHIANLLIKGVEGEAMLLQLDNQGFGVSTGSACSSGSLEPSHVLLAVGCPPEIAHGSLRISLGRDNTDEDIDRFLEVFPPIVERLRAMSPVYEKMFGAGAGK
jgi:cysteine desulfurase